MKRISIIIMIAVLGYGIPATAQYAGKKFISGDAMLSFYNGKQNDDRTVQTFGYNFAISPGKFSSDTRASGWMLSHGLGGVSGNQRYFIDGREVGFKAQPIRQLSFGVGRFWDFYKHFANNMGIYGGPMINVTYTQGKEYTQPSNAELYLKKSSEFSLAAGIRAGAYYKFAPKWWLTASIAFSQPVSVSYSSVKNEDLSGLGRNSGQDVFQYGFSPNLNLPSVGLGLRFFPGN